MKLNLMESGIQNINLIAKQYNKAKIYFHMDLDGITSALNFKQYLSQYGIQTVECQKIQYGAMEYSVLKPSSDDILPVLCDFAHGKPIMKIHTDHHSNQIQYQSASNHFRHSRSNADTISTIISPANIFPMEDIRIINMIDSANYKDEGFLPSDMINAVLKYKNDKTILRNHMEMGMIVNKLLLSYKNKPNFLESVVMNCNPSLISMYTFLVKVISEHIENGDKGWVSQEQIEKNSQSYYDDQSKKSIPEASIKDIEKMSYGANGLIGNCIVQIGGGNMMKTGSFDRYNAFRIYPQAKYFIMIWDSIGMMQVSANPWAEEKSELDLGQLIIKDIFENKWAKILNDSKYDISLLALKKEYEGMIKDENEKESLGFDLNEFVQLFNKEFDLTDEYQDKLEKSMKLKPSVFRPRENDEQLNERIMKMIRFLNSLKLPLPEIILKNSGGHPSITNLSGFSFLTTQQHLDWDLRKNKNPYTPYTPERKKSSNEPKKETEALKIMKDIAVDVVKELNKNGSITEGYVRRKSEFANSGIMFDNDYIEFEPGMEFIDNNDIKWTIDLVKNGTCVVHSENGRKARIEEDILNSQIFDLDEFHMVYNDKFFSLDDGKDE